MPDNGAKPRAGSAGLPELPVGWQWRRLGAICTSSQYGLSEAADEEGHFGMVGMRHLNGGRVSFRALTRVSLDAETVAKYCLRPNDVLFNRTNSFDLVGKTAIVPGDVPAQTVFASYLVRLVIDTGVMRPDLLCMFMNMSVGRRQLHRLITPGVSQFNINPSELLARFLVPVAPNVVQAAIADVGASFETAECQLEQLLETKRSLKRGLMQQLLTGKRRFPGFTEPWRGFPLREFLVQRNQRNSENCVSTVLSVTNSAGFVRSDEYFSGRVYSDDVSAYKIVRPGAFAFNPSRINVGSIARLRLEEPGILSPMYVVFDVRGALLPEYLEQWLTSYRAREHIRRQAAGSVRETVTFDALCSVKIDLPSIDEQRRIVDVLETCDREIAALNRQLELLEGQKKGLMQKLLTGQIRVGGEARR